MRRVFAILALVLTAWALLPGAAQAYGAGHEAPMSRACADCLDMTAHASSDHRADECHHATSCAIYGLPMTVSDTGPRPTVAQVLRPHGQTAVRSAMVARDLPPPRS